MLLAYRIAKSAFVIVSVAMTAAQMAEWYNKRRSPNAGKVGKNYEIKIPRGVKP